MSLQDALAHPHRNAGKASKKAKVGTTTATAGKAKHVAAKGKKQKKEDAEEEADVCAAAYMLLKVNTELDLAHGLHTGPLDVQRQGVQGPRRQVPHARGHRPQQ